MTDEQKRLLKEQHAKNCEMIIALKVQNKRIRQQLKGSK